MQTNKLVNFMFQDGAISMHVSVTEYIGQKTTHYTVSWHNTMRNDPYKSEPFGDKAEATQRGLKLRGYMYDDMASFLQQVM